MQHLEEAERMVEQVKAFDVRQKTIIVKSCVPEDYELAKNLYKKLLEMTHPESQERKIMKLDMEMIEPDDKTQ